MIGRIEGIAVHKDLRFIVLDVGGVGYKVFTPVGTLDKIKGQEKLAFWTHLVVREDALDLYGFDSRDDLEFFEMLISISGIGPKTALGILNIAPAKTLKKAIASGDTSYLMKVSGVGKKNAEKIVLELRDKLSEYEHEDGIAWKDEVDAVETLKALGYDKQEAREVLKEVGSEGTTSERVKKALKILGTK